MLKGNTPSEKWQYFKDYYLKTTLVIGAAIIFGIYILYTTVFAYKSPDSSNLASVLPTRFAAGDIDLLIAPEEIYKQYAQDDTVENVEGVSLKTSKTIKPYLSDADSLVIGIVKNSNDGEEKKETFNYLIQQ